MTWVLLLALFITVVLLYVGFLHDRSRGRPRCPRCWYNMSGSPSLVCPECGHDVRERRRLFKTRRRRWAWPCLIILAITWVHLWQIRVRRVDLNESWADAWKPNLYLLVTLPTSSSRVLQRRFDQLGVWPWESWIFLFHFDRQLTAPAPSAAAWIYLSRSMARHSQRVLDALVAHWDHKDTGLRLLAQDLAERHAERLTDELMYSLLRGATSPPRAGVAYRYTTIDRLLVEMARRDRTASREQTQQITAQVNARCRDKTRGMFTVLSWESCAPCLGDAQLADLLDHSLEATGRLGTSSDCFLTEMVRRGRPAFREQIARWAAQPPANLFARGFFPEVVSNLEIVTALRRLDGQPDPLKIFVEGAPLLECRTGKLPTLRVTIRNVDGYGAAVGFQRGGDSRSGRPARWRFDVRDGNGRQLPNRPMLSGEAGGLTSYKMLNPGESEEMTLDMNAFVQSLPPGRYHVVVQYHNSRTIADDDDVSNRIMTVSEPFELIVRR